jgi:DNA-directed RNA polymerase subunit RPC12/RpoP
MRSFRPANSCRHCGSTNYHRLFARDGTGALRPNGTYKCSGCKLNFTQFSEWRGATMESGDLAYLADLHHPAAQTFPGMAPA